MALAQAYLFNTITNFLGLSFKQREVLSDDRYDTISTIMHWKYDDIREWCTPKSKLKTTRVGDSHGERKFNCIQVLEWWDTNLTLRVKHIDIFDFDATTMADCIGESNLDY